MTTIEINSAKKIQKRKTGISRLLTKPLQSAQEIHSEQNKSFETSEAGQVKMHDSDTAPSIVHYDDEAILAGRDIYVKVNSSLKKLRTKDIYLIEGLCDYINIYTMDKRYTVYSTMYGILEKLPKTDFMRVHRSYIVRIDRISSIEDNKLSIEMRRIPVSKTYRQEVRSKLTNC